MTRSSNWSIRSIHSRALHLTEASSLCWQLLIPHGEWRHCVTLVSLPEQIRSSTHIGENISPDPNPVPTSALSLRQITVCCKLFTSSIIASDFFFINRVLIMSLYSLIVQWSPKHMDSVIIIHCALCLVLTNLDLFHYWVKQSPLKTYWLYSSYQNKIWWAKVELRLKLNTIWDI